MFPETLARRLRLPVIGAPMFLVSGADLVIAQCKAGIVGAFPSLNARPTAQLDEWLHRIVEELSAHDRAHPEAPSAPFAVNLIVHKTNDRLDEDLALLLKRRPPIVITSLGGREDVNAALHGYGALVMHDVISNRLAHKAVERGADGLVLVSAGAGGATGKTSPFALTHEVRSWFSGPLALSGAIGNGAAILAAQAAGADLAYVGSAFIAAHEANAPDAYKDMVVEGSAEDIVATTLFTGHTASFLKAAIARAGLDPDNLPAVPPRMINFAGNGAEAAAPAKTWRDIWGCGQGVAPIAETGPCAAYVERLGREYAEARAGARARLG